MVTHKGLHNGMVCGVHVGVQREGALSLAIVRCVSLRRDDPVLRAGRGAERFRLEETEDTGTVKVWIWNLGTNMTFSKLRLVENAEGSLLKKSY